MGDGDGLRKDPVLSVERAGEACVVKLGGELGHPEGDVLPGREWRSERRPLVEVGAGALEGSGNPAHAASPEQQERIVDIVNNARREIYGILGED